MEKVEEVALLPFIFPFFKRKNKYSYSYAGEKYLVVEGDGSVHIDNKPLKLIWNSANVFVYRIPEMQQGKSYTIETSSNNFHITNDISGIQSFYDRIIMQKITFTVVVYGIAIMLLLYFLPKVMEKYFQLAKTVVREGGDLLKTRISPLSSIDTSKPLWEIKGNWIIERLIPNLDKKQVLQWRHQIRYNSEGREHRFVFVQLQNKQWKLYEIWHPIDEYRKYEYYITNQIVRQVR